MKQLRLIALTIGVVLIIACAAPIASAERRSEHPRLVLTLPMSHREFHAVGSAVHAPGLPRPAWKALHTTWLAVHNYKAELCSNNFASRPKVDPLPSDVPAYEHILDAVAGNCLFVTSARLDSERGAIAEQMSSDQILFEGTSYLPDQAHGFCKALEVGDHVISSVIGHLAEKWFGEGIGELADFGTSVAIAECPVIFH